MKEAVILSTARTPIGKAFRGALNNLRSPSLAAHAIKAAVARAGIAADEVEDLVMGTAMPSGTAGWNLGRMSALAAGLPVSVSGQTLDRQCASGLMAIATAAKQIIVDGMHVTVGAGQENISAVQVRNLEWPWPSKTTRSSNRYRTPTCRCCTPPSMLPNATVSAVLRRMPTPCNRSCALPPPSKPGCSRPSSCQ